MFSYALGRCATCATAAVFIPTDGTISTRAPTRRSSCARDTARSGCRALGWLPRAFLAKIRVEECCNIYKGTQQLPERDGEERTHASLELENHVRVCRGTPPTVAPTRRPTVLCVSPPPLTPGRVGKGKKTPDGPAEGAPPPSLLLPLPMSLLYAARGAGTHGASRREWRAPAAPRSDASPGTGPPTPPRRAAREPRTCAHSDFTTLRP